MESIINYINDHLTIFIIIGLLLVIVFYSMISVFLNELHNAKYGKTTILSWIPPFNVYILGKMVLHPIIGLLLVIGLLFGICISFNISGLEKVHNLLPSNYVLPYQITYGVIILAFFVIAKFKLKRIIRTGTSKDSSIEFINKDYDNKAPDLVASTKQVQEVKEMIEDNYKYNHTSLSSLNTHTDNNKDNPSN